ncbi:hypothetical protein MKS88_002103 [Plasmodium brasilianum]|uniref:Cilia- and flagella-associated protein 299 n=2 Tax=Plasmodium (Plasmodium) TaxID=418103 RepID=A0A1D3JMR1_PLAMA|nr:conserved protein, unknown function [Plasmodium malariae]KAI4839546.1 hypothetical protein MKS88_002103 [Plasmodium brasilianum]SBT87971.1 conserved protein, unknown function [Plasmodium malariae]
MEKQIDNDLIYNSYEEYIRKRITPTDLFYIEDEELVFEIFSLGLKSRGVLSLEDFNSTYKKKKRNEKKPVKEENKENILYDINLLYSNTKDFFFTMNYHLHFCKENKISTILFIRYVNKQKYEISSYIDINMEKVRDKINRKKYIYASKKDLSYYNWHNNYTCTNSSENYEIVINKKIGLIFKHIHTNKYFILSSNKELKIKLSDNIYKDHSSKTNIVDGKEEMIKLCHDIKRMEVNDSNYLQCVLYTLHL